MSPFYDRQAIRRRRLYWLGATLVLAALSLLDVAIMAHLDALDAALPVALRQPAAAAAIIALALLPALALRAGMNVIAPYPNAVGRRIGAGTRMLRRSGRGIRRPGGRRGGPSESAA